MIQKKPNNSSKPQQKQQHQQPKDNDNSYQQHIQNTNNKIRDEQIDQLLDNQNDNDNDNDNDNYNDNNDQNDDEDQDRRQTKQQMVLKFKVNQLQKICNSLTSTNRKLIQKLTILQQQKQQRLQRQRQRQQAETLTRYQKKQQQVFVDQYSQLNTQFTQVQNLIHQYKHSLQLFQENALKDMKLKEQKLVKLKVQVKELTDRYNQLFLEKEDVEKVNKQLQTRNQGLILQIENLEKQKSRLQERINTYANAHANKPQFSQHGSRYDLHHHNQYQLPSEIQNQYQMIIDKLVKQLQYEKNIKKKMNQEIKRMAQQLMQSQKQIMSKNKKLYEMEMKLLKSSKTTADSSINYKLRNFNQQLKINANNYYNNQDSTPKHSGAKKVQNKLNFKSFVLLELINRELDEQVTNVERKIIGRKIVEFYQRKIERQDFSNVMPQNLLVVNFNHKKPELLSIRKVGTSVYEQGQKTQQSLVWNLAFILDNLFGQIQDVEQFDEILEFTGQALQKQLSNSRQSLQYMKEILSL